MPISLYINRSLLYHEVVEALYQIINHGDYKPGDRLPPERALIEELNVSRNVLREAFHILEERGVITSKQGKGRFLREVPKGLETSASLGYISKDLEKCSLLEAYEVRQALEVKAMELIVKNASDEDLQDIKKAYDVMVAHFETNRDTSGEFVMHKIYAEKTKSVFMERTLTLVLSTMLEMMHTTSHSLMTLHHIETEKVEHLEIVSCLLNRDEAGAKAAMFNHMQTSINMICDKTVSR